MDRAKGKQRHRRIYDEPILSQTRHIEAWPGELYWLHEGDYVIAFTRELFAYMGARKKWWLLPIMLVLFVFGGFLILAQGSAVAPFVYAVF